MFKLLFLLPALLSAGAGTAPRPVPAMPGQKAGADGPGDILWIMTYTGEPNGTDSARAIAVGNEGKVVVVGTGEGQGTGMDMTTVMYAPDGTQLWAARYSDTGASRDEAVDVTMDPDGNVIVVGEGGTSASDMDMTIIKYSAAGTEQWVARYNSPDNNGDFASAVTTDDSGNVYVTGYCLNISGINADYTTIKYSPAGAERWVARYNGAGDDNDYARDIAVDSSFSVYVTGDSRNANGNEDFVTIQYDETGIQQWVARYNGTATLSDKAAMLALDQLDNVVVTGSTQLEVGPPSTVDYLTIKYDGFGNEMWQAFFDGEASGNNYPTDLAITDSGEVCVTGASQGIDGRLDWATLRYSPEGQVQWESRYHGVGGDDAAPGDIAVDKAGRVYVTGYITNTSGNRDFATVRYESNGRQGWDATYDGTTAGDDAAVGIGLDGQDNVYVTGTGFFNGRGDDFVTIKYEANGIGVAEPGRTVRPATANLAPDPNPAHGRVRVNYTVPQPGPARLSVFGANGALVDTRELNSTSAGRHTVGLDIGHLIAGTYFLRLETSSGSAVGKLVVQ